MKKSAHRFGPKMLFFIILAAAILGFGYAGFRAYATGLALFTTGGAEVFATLPSSVDEVPSPFSAIDLLLSEQKFETHLVVMGWLFLPVTIWAIWAIMRKTRGMASRGKRIAVRILLTPLAVVGSFAVSFLLALFGSLYLGEWAASQVALARTGGEVDRIIAALQDPAERERRGIVTDPKKIIASIRENPTPPAIINDDSSFTANLVIAAAAAKGASRTAFEAVAIPWKVLHDRPENVLAHKIDADALLLPGFVLAVRNTDSEVGRELLAILSEKILRQQTAVLAAIQRSGLPPPKLSFLSVADYRRLRDDQKNRDLREVQEYVTYLEGQAARRPRDPDVQAALVRWRDIYNQYLEQPTALSDELGTFAAPDRVQVLVIDKNNAPADVPQYSALFVAHLLTVAHENLHYYSKNKDDLPSSFDEALTSYLEVAVHDDVKILLDPLLTVDDFSGYVPMRRVIDAVAERITLAGIVDVYFTGRDEQLSRAFDEAFDISYQEFRDGLDAIHFEPNEAAATAMADELIAKLSE